MAIKDFLLGSNRDEAGQRLVALDAFARGMLERYPHRIREYSQEREGVTMQTAQTLKEQQAQMDAEKKANRRRNRMLGMDIATDLIGNLGGTPEKAVSGKAASGTPASVTPTSNHRNYSRQLVQGKGDMGTLLGTRPAGSGVLKPGYENILDEEYF